jgi:hypothetical protein
LSYRGMKRLELTGAHKKNMVDLDLSAFVRALLAKLGGELLAQVRRGPGDGVNGVTLDPLVIRQLEERSDRAAK